MIPGTQHYGLVKAINEWQLRTFPDATPDSICTHLKREVEELSINPYDSMEIADVALLVMDLCQRTGVDLVSALDAKFQINLARKWGEPDEEGVVEHIDA